MTKQTSLCCAVFLILGLTLGYIYARVQAGKLAASTLEVLQMTDLSACSERAMKAYQHESAPVAIYALTEVLEKQKEMEKSGNAANGGKSIVTIDLVLTHARLAKLYAESGRTNSSAEHVEEALRCAEANGRLAITNQESLMAFLAGFDKAAK